MAGQRKSNTRRSPSVSGAFRKLAKALTALAVAVSSAGGKAARPQRRNLSPKARKALQLQGRYMGIVRHLPPAEKARLKRIKDAKGVEAAIRAARRA